MELSRDLGLKTGIWGWRLGYGPGGWGEGGVEEEEEKKEKTPHMCESIGHPCCLSEWLLKVLHQSPLLPVETARNWVGFHGPQIESKNTSI